MNRVDRRLVLGAGALLGAGLATKGFAAETATTGYAKVDGLKVYYEVHGGPLAGLPPFVLLHGGMMTIETAFPDGFLARLARVRPLIAIEQQGHGHTADRERAQPGPHVRRYCRRAGASGRETGAFRRS
uniref:Alpha/beta hydrolase n=1 Tax=Phenylobacterium glaciei TaxID=2803784 RepID=A0A974S8A1_9CAUL|nr:alpha/beta hydrolase [Phenylobacterium glaciei]